MHATFQGAGMSRTRLSHGGRQKKTKTRLSCFKFKPSYFQLDYVRLVKLGLLG